MGQVGMRIFFNTETGEVLAVLGEMEGDVLPRAEVNQPGVVDFPFGYRAMEFARAIRYHIDVETKEVIFDELAPEVLTEAEQIAALEQQNAELEMQILQIEGVLNSGQSISG